MLKLHPTWVGIKRVFRAKIFSDCSRSLAKLGRSRLPLFPLRRCYLCALLAFCCTLLLAAPGAAQWPPIMNSATPTEPPLGWRPNAERSCGRLVCSDVYLYGAPGASFTVAGPAADPDAAGLSVETRAQLVQRSFREV